MTPTPSERLRSLGLDLPPPPSPAGSYAPVILHDGLAWVSGQIPARSGSVVSPGLVGGEVDLTTAKTLARLATLQALSALAASLGSIDRIQRVVRVGVYVASAPGFTRQHEVGNGSTELLMELFGEDGR